MSALAAIPVGGSRVLVAGGKTIALARRGGTVVAHTGICTHEGCTVLADGAALSCPCHGSRYDAFTGAVTRSPALRALDEIPIIVANDAVYLEP